MSDEKYISISVSSEVRAKWEKEHGAEAMSGEPEAPPPIREVAWIIHEVASLGDDEAAKDFDHMGEMWYNILMEAAWKISNLLAPSDTVEPEASGEPHLHSSCNYTAYKLSNGGLFCNKCGYYKQADPTVEGAREALEQLSKMFTGPTHIVGGDPSEFAKGWHTAIAKVRAALASQAPVQREEKP